MDLDRVTGWLAEAESVTVLCGAGISTDSGIPDFRGPNGVWTRNPAAQQMFTLQNYLADPAVRRQAWRNRRDHPAWTAQPNPAHHALVDLERSGRLQAIITQNIDGLQQQAGSPTEQVIEIHGTMRAVQCLDCGDRQPMVDVLARVDAGEADPPCRRCGGVLKSATISFGQALVPEVLAAALAAAQDCQLFLAVGSSLSVQPAAGLTEIAHRSGARVVIVNAEPTPYDDLADALLREPIGDVLPALVRGALAGAG
ncbi:MAG: Sir2 family NAD-dependent protein deacetylase [Actinomycetota bacterium]|nr:Sir2 family NAD-dependent protein deacetylase [Actinomycetota bacterium]